MLVQKSFFFRYFTVLFVTIFLSVSYATADTLDNDSDDEKTYNLNIIPKNDPLTQNMSALKKEVFNKLINNQPIKFSDIRKLLIEEQENYYQADANKSSTDNSVDEINSKINELTSKVNECSDITQAKVEIEKQFSTPPQYNEIATSISYIFKENRLNCYSSTLLHLLVLRSNPNLKNKNMVAIFKPYHILSGFLTKTENSWNLTAVENTRLGKCLIDLGNIKDHNIPATIIDSDLFLIFEIFKPNILNVHSVVKQIIDSTAKKYNIDPTNLHNEYKFLDPNASDETQHKDYTELSSNYSLLGTIAGISGLIYDKDFHNDQGDKERTYSDSITQEEFNKHFSTKCLDHAIKSNLKYSAHFDSLKNSLIGDNNIDLENVDVTVSLNAQNKQLIIRYTTNDTTDTNEPKILYEVIFKLNNEITVKSDNEFSIFALQVISSIYFDSKTKKLQRDDISETKPKQVAIVFKFKKAEDSNTSSINLFDIFNIGYNKMLPGLSEQFSFTSIQE